MSSGKKYGKGRVSQVQGPPRVSEKAADGPPVELENQFIMRLPEEPAGALREAIKSGASNLKERLFIQLEPDKGSNTQYLRKGHVQFDKWNFTSRLQDLPTIVESHKTIDNKFFYKTADICQLLICKEGEGFSDEEEPSSPVKKKKLDTYKVDKKYLFPHGVAAPLKNCRKRRFRKTLKKKYVEAPEIEKEVKRLLRVDYEAVSVKWEVITEEELSSNKGGEAGGHNPDVKPSVSGDFVNDAAGLGLDLSDSEDEGRHGGDMDSDDNSRMSGTAEDSRMSDSASASTSKAGTSKVTGPTSFSKDMFKQEKLGSRSDQMAEAKMQMMHLQSKRKELEHNISNCPNEALKNRFRSELLTVNTEIKKLESSGLI